MEGIYQHTDAFRMLKVGEQRLGLPPSASLELIRFLSVKRIHDTFFEGGKILNMSPGSRVDELWHFMLENTEVAEAVHELLGGRVKHIGTDEDDLEDEVKMLQRLYSMNLMSRQGYAPQFDLWEEPGTLMNQVVTIWHGDMELLAVPGISATQRQLLVAAVNVLLKPAAPAVGPAVRMRHGAAPQPPTGAAWRFRLRDLSGREEEVFRDPHVKISDIRGKHVPGRDVLQYRLLYRGEVLRTDVAASAYPFADGDVLLVMPC
eukprot:jgi/Botrbrau1/21179/Bobra.0061s0070.1